MKKVSLKEYDKFTLPFGLITKDNRVLKDFALNPLTGRMRQQVLQASEKRPNIELLTNAVHAMVGRIGDIVAPPRSYIESLTTYDRDYILFVSRYLHETEERVTGTCDGCGIELEATVNLDDIDVFLPDENEFTRQGMDWTYLYRDVANGIESCLMRLRTVKDEEDAFKGGRDKIAYAPTFKLTAASILDFNGNGKLSESAVADLPVKTLDSFAELFDSQKFGPDLTVIVTCENCSAQKEFTLDVLSHFFGPGVRKGPKSSTARL